MRGFTFHHGPALLNGADNLQALTARLPKGRCLLVSDAGIVRLGLLERCRDALDASGRNVALFGGVEPATSRQTLLAAVELGRQAGAVSVVGFGGGSPMDVAKLAAYLLGSGDDL